MVAVQFSLHPPSLQPTSVQVWLIAGSEYTVKHRNFEYWSSAWPITLKIWKRKSVAEFRSRGIRRIPARHFRARLFFRPFLVGLVRGPDYALVWLGGTSSLTPQSLREVISLKNLLGGDRSSTTPGMHRHCFIRKKISPPSILPLSTLSPIKGAH